MPLRPANKRDAPALSELALRSKAHWGYDQQFMDSCKDELSHQPEDIGSALNHYVICDEGARIQGFYKLTRLSREQIELEALFVEPADIGKGVGRQLFLDGFKKAQALGCTELITHSDPYAEAFYLKMGGKMIGTVESGSIPGRTLPLISFSLPAIR